MYALKYDFAHTHVGFHKKPMEVRESPTGQIIVNGKVIEASFDFHIGKMLMQFGASES